MLEGEKVYQESEQFVLQHLSETAKLDRQRRDAQSASDSDSEKRNQARAQGEGSKRVKTADEEEKEVGYQDMYNTPLHDQ